MPESLSTDQLFIKKLTEIVLANLENENFGVKELAGESGLSMYALSRKLHSINRKTVNQFIREVRLHKALEMLQNDYTASEVAFRTGFGSASYFNKCFHEFFGYSPGKVKKSGVNNWEEAILNQAIAENKLKVIWKSYILTFRGLSIVILAIAVTGFFIYRLFFDQDLNEDLLSSDGKISIAVMPFRNLTNDTTWNLWQDGIQEYLIGSLAKNKELKVWHKDIINVLIQTEGITKFASVSPEFAGKISRKLDAGLFVYGSILKSGPKTKLVAQLIGVKTGEVLTSAEINVLQGNEPEWDTLDSLQKKLTDYLVISKLIKQNPVYSTHPLSTNSSEAFKYFLLGDQANDKGETNVAISWYLKALEIDSGFFEPMLRLSTVYGNMGMQTKNLEWVLRYYNKRNQWSYPIQVAASWAYACSFESPEEQIKYLKQGEQLVEMDPSVHFMIGLTYISMKQYDKAIPEFLRYSEIQKKWFGKESYKDLSNYYYLGIAYHMTGQYKREKDLYKLAERYIPENPFIITNKAILAFSKNDTVAAKKEIGRYILYKKKNSSTEADSDQGVGDIYYQAGLMDKAEDFYRKALALEPENPEKMTALANFLVESNRNLDEVQGLMDKVMGSVQDSMVYYNCLDTKGMALYKQGKYREALAIFRKTYDKAPFKLYSYKSHLEEAEKAAVEQK